MSRISRFASVLATVSVIVTLTGCFDEPTPAYKTVPAEARLYWQDRSLENLAGLDFGASPERIDYLNLDRNYLTDIAPVAKLTGLKWLRLNENRLMKLPDLSALVKLRRIYLRDNHLTEVPSTLEQLPELTDIELSGNPIRQLPDWLMHKASLRNLSFNRTLLDTLPQDLSGWRSLKSLQLGELKLSAAEMSRIRAALPDTRISF